MTWRVEHRAGSAADLHAAPVPEPAGRTALVCEPTGASIVLGSTQPTDLIDHPACEAADVAVVRRRSGGGAVLVVPGDLLWVDLVIPAEDPLWLADVGRAFQWVGQVWGAALRELGYDPEVHDGAPVCGHWSRLVCFAGIGSGEVTLGGRKVVGIAQRRTRGWARFQCAALLSWDPIRLASLLALDVEDRSRAGVDLARVAVGLAVEPDAVLSALMGQLAAREGTVRGEVGRSG